MFPNEMHIGFLPTLPNPERDTMVKMLYLPIYSMGDIDFSNRKFQNFFLRTTAVFRERLHL